MPTKGNLTVLQGIISYNLDNEYSSAYHNVAGWTTINGVNGWLINADDYASTGKQLFLPAAGNWSDNLYYHGDLGTYRSSTYGDADGAWFFAIYSGGAAVDEAYNRVPGYSVRPVHK